MKINHKIILYFVGFLLLFNGGFMFVSSIVSYYYKDGITMDMIYSGIIVTLIGGLLLFLNRNHDKQLNKRGLSFIRLNKVNISSSQLRKI